jgi:magnesium transporter
MLDDKYIGVALAVCGSGLIGSSYVIANIGLRDAIERHSFKGDEFEYIKNPLRWTGIVMLVMGELFNFAAYTFAPAVLVTPLGALSVLTRTILGAYFLKERLGTLGKLGCALCIVGSVLIVANAPPDKDIQTVDEIKDYALKLGKSLRTSLQDGQANTARVYTIRFHHCSLFRCHDILSLPPIGTMNPLYYLSICSATGAVSVIALKAFGIALKLTFAGANQFARPSTYIFAIVAILCIIIQMNYFHKALRTFPQSL